MTYECCCADISIGKWEILMKNARRMNKKILNKLVKQNLPELYNALSLDLFNPYNYFQTPTHYILVHSAIEYFIRKEG